MIGPSRDLREVGHDEDLVVGAEGGQRLSDGQSGFSSDAGIHLARKSQKTQEIKEIKMRPNIDDHDYDVKMKKVFAFIGEGDKVKITLRFRGRELAHGELGMRLLQRVQADVAETAKVEQHPRMEGRQMLMVLAPEIGRVRPIHARIRGSKRRRRRAASRRSAADVRGVRKRSFP